MVRILIVFTLCCSASFLTAQVEGEETMVVRNGGLAIDIDVFEREAVGLNGDWEMYWGQLLKPGDIATATDLSPIYSRLPQLWNGATDHEEMKLGKGAATYRLRIIFDEQPPMLALSLPDFYTSYKLWVNGEPLAHNGKVGKGKASSKPHWQPQVVPISIQGKEMEIVLQMANFHHRFGGLGEPIVLGKSKMIIDQQALISNLSWVIFGCLVMCGLFLLGLYAFGQGDKATLFFAAFCLAHSYRMIGAEHYVLHQAIPGLPFWFTAKLEYISLYLSISFFWEYGRQILPDVLSHKANRFVRWLLYGCTLIVVVSPINYYAYTLEIVKPLLLLSVAYGTICLLRASYRDWQSMLFFIAGIAALFVVLIVTLLDYMRILQPDPFIILSAYISFLFFETLHLSKRFATVYQERADVAALANKAKTEFLTTVSHEIRTPMNGVIGMTDLLGQLPLSQEAQNYVDTIKLSGNNLVEIINDILDLSKIEAERMDLESEPFSIHALVNQLLELLKPRAEQKDLLLACEIGENVPEIVEGDVTRIRQVFTNLVSNAIKFTEQGEIIVQLRLIKQDKETIKCQLDVKDTGIGIPADRLSTLFLPFSQIDASISRKYGGTGLGLAISRRLAKLMGGDISVNSEENKGSTFSVSLPLKRSAVTVDEWKAKHAEVPKANSHQLLAEELPLSILVAEDHPINQQLMQILLRKLGYEPTIAVDGAGVLNRLQKASFDLIFMDVQMPIIDGLEATRQIYSSFTQKEIPIIIAMTANALQGDRENCINAGMHDYVAKPLTPGIVEEMIRKWGKAAS